MEYTSDFYEKFGSMVTNLKCFVRVIILFISFIIKIIHVYWHHYLSAKILIFLEWRNIFMKIYL